MKCFLFSLLGLLLWLIPSSPRAQFYNRLNDIVASHQLMGMSVVTLCNGEIAEKHVFGYGHEGRGEEMTDSTRFRVASVSKMVTAMGIMLLHDQGRLKLDDDVSAYLPYDLRNPNHPNVPVTFRMLLSHTSGLTDGGNYDLFLDESRDNPLPPDMRELLLPSGVFYAEETWLRHAPGTYFFYCNLNYGILAALIERISGQRFDRFMRDRLLRPLGIRGSFHVVDLPENGLLAGLYRGVNGEWSVQADDMAAPPAVDAASYVPGTNGLVFSPQGGLRISATELARLALLHVNRGEYEGRQVLSPEAIDLMHEPAWSFNGRNGDSEDGLFREWGAGVQRITNAPYGDVVYPETAMYGHSGEAYGGLADVFFEMDNRSGFVVLVNGSMKGYHLGEKSAFFRVEEELFEALHDGPYRSCRGQSDSRDPFHLSVWPNPASQVLFIRSHSILSPKTVIIRDIGGRTMWENTISTGQIIQVDISAWNFGFYEVEANYNNRVFHGWIEVVR